MSTLHYKATFSSSCGKREVVIKNFNFFKVFLLELSKKYLIDCIDKLKAHKGTKNKNTMGDINQITGDLNDLSNLALINPKVTNINGYSTLDHSNYINISLKPFKNFMTKPPIAFLRFKIGGVWWLLVSDVKEDRLTYYQIKEIKDTLKLLNVFKDNNNIKFERDKDYMNLLNFLINVNPRFVNIKIS